MNNNINLDDNLPGEPPLRIDFNELAQTGGRRVRRRRTAAVIGAASVAVVIVVGTSILVPRMRDTAGSGGIPGCSKVLGPTNSNKAAAAAESSSATGPGMGDGVPPASSAAQVMESTAAASSAEATLPAVSSAEATSSPQLTETIEPTAGPTSSEQIDNRAVLDASAAPDPLTAATWSLLTDWSAVARTDTQLTLPSFKLNSEVESSTEIGWSIGMDGFVETPTGVGDFYIESGYDGRGVPDCHVGELDRRVTYPDGTVVDLSSGTYQSNSVQGDGQMTTGTHTQVHAVGYHPDGTIVIAMSSDSLSFMGVGNRSSGATPLTLEQVQQLAANEIFRHTGPLVGSVTTRFDSAEVPNVVGLSQDEAFSALEMSGISVKPEIIVQEVTDPSWVGIVVMQSPAAGELISGEESVQVTVGIPVSPSKGSAATVSSASSGEKSTG